MEDGKCLLWADNNTAFHYDAMIQEPKINKCSSSKEPYRGKSRSRPGHRHAKGEISKACDQRQEKESCSHSLEMETPILLKEKVVTITR